MSKRDIKLLLGDMLIAIKKIKQYTNNYDFEKFIEDEKTKDAVVRNFEIIGEAANRIGEDFQLKHSEIEWKRIKGLRNRIVHEYFGIDYEIVWDIVTDYMDELLQWLEVIK